MPTPIKFGTSGWRGLIARDFTFDNVRVATQGIADHWKAELERPGSPIHGRKPVVIIGHDTRFLGREFALAVAEVLAANGLQPLLCQRDAPTPVIAFAIRSKKAIGGINMTASHNPAEYQGLKFSVQNGAAAPPKSPSRSRPTSASVRTKVGPSRQRLSAPTSAAPSIPHPTTSSRSASSSTSNPSGRPSSRSPSN